MKEITFIIKFAIEFTFLDFDVYLTYLIFKVFAIIILMIEYGRG